MTQTTQTEAQFVGEEGHRYTFRLKATDNLGNTNPIWLNSQTVQIQTITKYYLFGGQRVAMRVGTGPQSAVYYLHGDHLGSVSMTTGADGTLVSQARYTPFGGQHWESGEAQTDFGFTGQRAERGMGLLDYNARFYAASVGRFVSADSIVPNALNPMAFDRYGYSLNNSLNNLDPSGYRTCTAQHSTTEDETCDQNLPEKPLSETGAVIPGLDSPGLNGGKGVNALFLLYQQTPGWWNDYDGDGIVDHTLTLEEFVGLWILFESGGDFLKAELIAIAIAQRLFVGGWRDPYCPNPQNCSTGVFNFMADQSQGAGRLFQGPQYSGVKNFPAWNPKLSVEEWRKFIREIGAKALNADYVVSWDQNKGPSDWGNRVGIPDLKNAPYLIPEFHVNGLDETTVYYYYGNFAVLSVNQSNYWDDKVDWSFPE